MHTLHAAGRCGGPLSEHRTGTDLQDPTGQPVVALLPLELALGLLLRHEIMKVLQCLL
eukprot:COSAG01_NODE_2645_length_7321_cov_35.717391_6_plen_57_part_01